MASSYPSALDTFTTAHSAGQTILSADINNLADAVNKIEAALGVGPQMETVFNVTKAPYSATPDVFFSNGSITSGGTTLTTSTPAFVAGDVGKYVVVEKGVSANLAYHAIISAFNSSTSVTVALLSLSTWGRSQSNVRFLISRGGDQLAAIQAAADAAEAAGGGVVYLDGPGFLVNGTVQLGNRVTLRGRGRRATILHIPGNDAAGSKHTQLQPVVVNKTTLDNTAANTRVDHLTIDGAADFQLDFTMSLGAQYNSGAGTITLNTTNANLLPSGTLVLINGGNQTRVHYTSVSGTTINVSEAGVEGTTDQTYTVAGTTVSFPTQLSGIYMANNPPNSTTDGEGGDLHNYVSDMEIRYTRGYGLFWAGLSESRGDNIRIFNTIDVGFRPSYDSFLSNCTAHDTGRMGFYVRGSSGVGTNLKAFGCGNNISADGWGFMFEGPTAVEEGCKTWGPLNSQDNKAGGVLVRNAQRIHAFGTLSSNSGASAGTYPGLRIDGATSCNLQFLCTDREYTGVGTILQQNSIELLETGSVPNANNFIVISHLGTGTDLSNARTKLGAAIKSGSVLKDPTNMIIVNGAVVFGGGWSTLSKTATQTKTNNTLIDDDTMSFAMVANVKYRVRAMIFFDTTAAGDFLYTFVGPGSPTLFRAELNATIAGGTPAETVLLTAYPSSGGVALAGTGTTGGLITFDGVIHNGSNASNFTFRFAQNTTTADTGAQVLAGSYLDWQVA